MKKMLVSFACQMVSFACLFLALTPSYGQIVVPPQPVAPVPPKAAIVPATLSTKAGDVVELDASAAGGAVRFLVSDPSLGVKIDGKKIFVAIPLRDLAWKFSIQTIAFKEESLLTTVVSVAGKPAPPEPSARETLIQLQTDMAAGFAAIAKQQNAQVIDLASIKQRLAALEGPKPPPVVPTPVITSPLTASAVAGQAFLYTITATNSPTSFGASGLPAGITINPALMGQFLSGTPTTAGVYTIDLSASNASGTAAAKLILTVAATGPTPPNPPTPTAATLDLVVIWESADSTPAIASVMKDLDFWRSLEPAGNRWFQLDKDQKDGRGNRLADVAGYQPYIDKLGLPTLLLMDQKSGKVLQAVRLPATTDGVRALIKTTTGK